MISIEFSVTSGEFLDVVLESIRSQTSQDYEVVVVNSNKNCSDIIKEFDAKEIFIKTGKLEARRLAHKQSSGENELILEETRILRRYALEKLGNFCNMDMTIINELEIGDKLINRLNRIDAQISFTYTNNTPDNLFLLPRFFRREVLDYSLEKAYIQLPFELVSKVVASDLEIIYTEAYKKFQNVGKLKEVVIERFGDKSIISSFKKYYRYGKSQRILSKTSYEDFYALKKRKRILPSPKYLPAIGLMYAIRGSAFLLGYLSG